MVAVVSGSGLGLYSTSQTTRESLGSSSQGQNPEQIYVNTATGNLVIQDQDEELNSLGSELSLLRTYNSQGVMDDDNGDNWRLGVQQRVLNLTGTVNTAGSTITKEFGDGSLLVYTYNATLGLYTNALGNGADDTLSFNSSSSTWTWTAGQSRNTEQYNSSGQIVSSSDVNGNTATYGYTGNLLTQVTDASGQTTYLDYSGNNLTDVRVVSGGQTQTLTRYTYDTQNRLSTVTVDLTPADNSVSDGKSYTTTYTYDGTSTRVTSITQGDGTSVSFAYVLQDGLYRLHTYTDGDGKVTTFAYSSPSSTGPAGSTSAAANSGVLSTTGTTGSTYNLNSAQLSTTTTTTQSYNLNSSALTLPTSTINNVQWDWVRNEAGVTSITVNAATAQQAGDLNVIAVGWAPPSPSATITSITDTMGNVYTLATGPVNFPDGAASQSIYYAKNIAAAAAGANTVTINFSTTVGVDVRMAEYSGVATTNPLDGASSGAGTSATESAGNITTTTTPDLIVAGGGGEGTSITAGTGFTARTLTSGAAILEDEVVSPGTYNATATESTSTPYIFQAAAFHAQVTGAAYYSVPSGATWQSIANALYGVNSAAAGAALQTAMGSPTLSTGLHLTGLPATLSVTTTTTVPAYYAVPAAATWQSIANTLYGVNSAAAGSALQTAMGSPTLTTGLHLTGLPSTLTVGTTSTVPAYYTVPSGATWSSVTSAIYGTTNANAIAALQAATGNPTLTTGLHLTVPLTLVYSTPETLYLRTDVTDPVGQVSSVITDAQGRVSSTLSPAVNGVQLRTDYTYDSNNDILTVTTDASGLNRVTTNTYDSNGNLTSTRDADGNTVTRTYNSANQLVTQTTYQVPDPDGSGTGQPSGPMTVRYAYDSLNRLRYTITGDGRVTENRYNSVGEVTSKLQYDGAVYNVSALAATATLSESTMSTWAASQDLTKVERTDFTYDFRGNVSSMTVYSATDSTGVGIAIDAAVTNFVYDQRGMLIQEIDPRGTTSSGTYVTNYVYDGLGRLTSSSQWVQSGAVATTTTTYDAANNRVLTTMANGTVKTAVYDHAGHLISVNNTDSSSNNLGTTTYAYDADGRLRMTTDPDGVKTYVIYDEAGRKAGDIDGDGNLTQYVYNTANQVVKTIAYADALTSTTLATLVDASGNPTTVPIATLVAALPTTVGRASDQISRNVYDAAGLKTYSIDPNGAVTGYTYDGAGRIVQQTAYAQTSSIASTVTQVPNTFAPTATPGSDRATRNFYDNDGDLVGTLDANGYLTQYTFDAGGHLVQKMAYATASPSAYLAAGTLAQLVPAADNETTTTEAEDQATYYFYDDEGRQIGEYQQALVDGTGYLTETQYDAAGNVSATIRYDRALTYTAGTSTFATLKSAATAAGAAPQTTSYQYDGQNHVLQETDFQGTVTAYAYNIAGQLISQTTAVGATGIANDTRLTQTRYDGLGRVIGTLSGLGSAQLTAGLTQAQINAIWSQYGTTYTYDGDGRRTSATTQAHDPIAGTTQTNTTYYYYDADGNLRYTVDPTGDVTETRYNALGEVTDQFKYFTALSSMTGLTGGLLTSTNTPTGALTVSPTTDSHSSFTYKLGGQLASSQSAEGAHFAHSYDAFGDETGRTTQVDATRTRVESFTYDNLGHLKSHVADAGGIAQSQSYLYDAFGRQYQATDQYGNTTKTSYDRMGRVIWTYDALGKGTHTTYDAFSRVLTTVDAFNKTTTYAYNATNRTMTVTTPTGVAVTTTYNRNGQILTVASNGNTTTHAYDLNGNLSSSSDGLGALESRSYDSQGREITSSDGRGIVTRFTYDAANRVLTQIVDNGGLALTTTYQYNGFGLVKRVTEPGNKVTTTSYDRDGRVTQVAVDPDSGGLNIRTTYAYDDLNDQTTVTVGAGSTNPQVTNYQYDVLGRLTRQTVDPGSGVNAATGQPYVNAVTNYYYDADNNLICKVDPNNHGTWYVYDADNRVVATVNAAGDVTATTYDLDGRVTSTLHYANTVSLTTPAPGSTPSRLTLAQVTPTANSTADQLSRNYYDDDGRQIYSIDAMGGVTERQFDANGNVTRQRVFSGIALTGAYANAAAVTAALGTRVSSIGSADRVTWTTYDLRGRAIFTENALGAVTQNTYDLDGNLTSTVQYAALRSLTDTNSIATFATNNASNTQNRTTRYWYDNNNRQVFVLDGGNYLTQTTYDDVNRKVTTTAYYAQASVPAAATTSDLKNRVNGVTVTATAARDETTEKDYDAAGRLIKVLDVPSGTYETYGYDAVGNKTSYTNQAQKTWTYVYDGNHDLMEEHSPFVDSTYVTVGTGSALSATTVNSQIVTRMTYDAMGNVLSRMEGIKISSTGVEDDTASRRTTYQYDVLGRQTQVAAPSILVYAPPANDQNTAGAGVTRVETSQAPTTILTYDSLGNAIVDKDANGNNSYKVYDQLDRVTFAIDADGYVTGYTYDTFGNVLTTTRYANSIGTISGTVTALSGTPPATQPPVITVTTTTGTTNITVATSTQDRTITDSYNADNSLHSVVQPVVFFFDPNSDSAGGNGANTAPTTSYLYNAFGQVTNVNNLVDPITGAFSNAFSYYDNRGLKTADVNAGSYLTTYTYDAFTNLKTTIDYAVKLTGTINTSTYGTVTASNQATQPAGNPNGGWDRETDYDYTQKNLMTTKTLVGVYYTTMSGSAGSLTSSSTFGNQVTTYGYDVLGNQASVNVNGGTTYTYYDVLGRVIAVTSPTTQTGNGSNTVTPLTVMKRDVYGNLVEQIAYAAGATAAQVGGATPPAPAALTANLDRTTIIRVDLNGDALQTEQQFDPNAAADAITGTTIDKFASYTITGAVAKEWQIVTNPGDATQALTTDALVTIYKYDKRGNQTDVITPQSLGTTNVVTDTYSHYDAFGEIDYKSVDGTQQEFFNYDNGGRLWRTNTGDGEWRVYLYNLAGQSTAKIEEPEGSSIVMSSFTDPGTVYSTGGLLRTETVYDALGHVTEQRQPVYTAPSSQVAVGTDVQINTSNGVTYLTWPAPADSTLQPTLYIDGVAQTITTVSGSGSEYGYVAGFPVGGLANGSHTYRIEYYRPGDSTLYGLATGTFTVNTTTATGISASTVSVGSVGTVTTAFGGSGVTVSWPGDSTVLNATFEINIGGTWQKYTASGSDSGGWSVSFAVPAAGTYQYRITDSISNETEAIGTGTITFTAGSSTSTTTTSGTASADPAYTVPGPLTASPTIGTQGTGSVTGSAIDVQTPITDESGNITGYTTSWSGTSSVYLSWIPNLASGTYTINLYYNTYADPSKGLAASAASLSFSWTGGTNATYGWTNTATGTGSTWPPGGISSISYYQVLSGGTVVVDSRTAAVSSTQFSWAAPADTSYSGTFQYRLTGTSTYSQLPATRSGNTFYVNIANLPAGTYDFISADFQGTSESPTNLTQASGQFVVTAGTTYIASQAGTPVYLSGASVSGSNLYWASAPQSGDSISVTLNNPSTGAVMYTLTPQTSDGTNYFASFYNIPTGSYHYSIQYIHGGVVYKTATGSISVTTTTTVNTINPAVSNSAATNVSGVGGFTDIGNGNLEWTTPANSGDSVVFYYMPSTASAWTGTLPINGSSGAYYVNVNSLPVGAYAFEVVYTASGASQPYRVQWGGMSITRTTSTTGTTTDTTASNLTSTPATPKQKQTNDRWGDILSSTDTAGNTTWYDYNQLGEVYETDLPSVNVASVTSTSGALTGTYSSSPNLPTFEYNFYDIYGRLVGTRDADGHVNGRTYNVANEVISEAHADGGTRSYVYDAFGDQIQITNEDGYKTENAYDQAGRLTDVEQEVVAGAYTGAVTGAAKDLLAFTAANIVRTSYTYDQAGRRLSASDGDSLAANTSAAETVHYWYDLEGNTTKMTNALGAITQYRYNEQSREVGETDNNSHTESWSYDYFGHLLTHVDMGGTTYSYSYDQGHSWLLTGETSTLGNFSGVSKSYTYDSVNHLTQVTDSGAHITTTYAYDAYGRLAHQQTFDNGLMVEDTRTEYDQQDRIAHLSGIGYSVTYQYDSAGNRTAILANYSSSAGVVNSQNLYYSYDAMNRVLIDGGSLSGSTVSVTATQGTSLTYDKAGNRTSATTEGNVISLSGTTYSQSAGIVTQNYTYDGMNRLVTTSQNVGATPLTTDHRYYDKASRTTEDDTTYVDGAKLSTNAVQNTYLDDGTLNYTNTYKNGIIQQSVTYGGHYDGVGNLNSYAFSVYNASGTLQYSGTDSYTYLLGDSYLQQVHTITNGSGGPLSGSTTDAYNVDQQLVTYTDSRDATKNRYFDNNEQGQALLVVQGNNGTDPSGAFTQAMMSGSGFFSSANAGYFFFTGDDKAVGTFGQLSGSLTANFDVNYTPISSSYPATVPPNYIVQAGDTLQSIAARLYGDPKLWYVIAQANGLGTTAPNAALTADTQLTIPANVVSLSNNSSSYKPFDVRLALGDQTPTQPMPPPPKHGGGCGVIGTILMVVVAVVVTIYTAGAAAEMMSAAYSTAAGAAAGTAGVSGTFAAGAAAIGGSVTGGALGAATGIAAAAVGGAVGSIASQAVGIATGNQSGFNWGDVAVGAIGAGVTAGMGEAVQGGGILADAASSSNPYVVAGVEGAVGNAITQGVSVAAGLQSSFNWDSVALSAVTAPLAKYAGSQVSGGPGNIDSNLAAGAVGAAVRIAVGGKINTADVLADAFGTALGNSLVSSESTTGRVGTTADTGNAQDELDEIHVTAQRIDTSGSSLESNPEPRLQNFQLDPDSIPTPNIPIKLVAPAGASISTIMGTSNPVSIEAFMHANGMTGTDSTIFAGKTYYYPGDADFAASTGAMGQAVLDTDNLRQLQPVTPTAERIPVDNQPMGNMDLSQSSPAAPTLTQTLLNNAAQLSQAADQYSDSSLTGIALRQAASDNLAGAGMADLASKAWKWLQTPWQPGVQTQQYMNNAAQQQLDGVQQALADPNTTWWQKIGLYQVQSSAYDLMGSASQVPTTYGGVGMAAVNVATMGAPLVKGLTAAGTAAKTLATATTEVGEVAAVTEQGAANATQFVGPGIGRSGYQSSGEFTDAVTAKYQELYDQSYDTVSQQVKQGIVADNNTVIGSKVDSLARTGLRDWLSTSEGIEEGQGSLIQVNRRMYDPAGTGDFRVPDVYIPSSNTILDGTIALKTGNLPQIADFWKFSSANVNIIRPTTLRTGMYEGSYGLLQ